METQRAYTFRLKGLPDCEGNDWKEPLWRTHLTVNKAAAMFGDWLMTFRGGICHELAERPDLYGKDKTPENDPERHDYIRPYPAGLPGEDQIENDPERHDYIRRLLILSWLSVESAAGAPEKYVVVSADEDTGKRQRLLLDALETILKKREMQAKEIPGWLVIGEEILCVPIRSDAVWVNRSEAFDDLCKQIAPPPSREDIWDFLGRMYHKDGGINTSRSYFAAVKDGDIAEAKDMVQNAGNWLSSRAGGGKGADYGLFERIYRILQDVLQSSSGTNSADVPEMLKKIRQRGDKLFEQGELTWKMIDQVLSGSGYKSATKNLLKKLDEEAPELLSSEMKDKLSQAVDKDLGSAVEKQKNPKGPRPYSEYLLKRSIDDHGVGYSSPDRRNYHGEFSVILDHAMRHVSQAHTWIKRAEAERAEFNEKATALEKTPDDAREWLDEYCEERRIDSGGLDEYTIRPKAIDCWADVLKAWKKNKAKTVEQRVEIVREVQAESDNFGDARLFEALADDSGGCVWAKYDDKILKNYVSGMDARRKQRHFKVPAYRHPDPLRHPVFVDFGKSRFSVAFDIQKPQTEFSKGVTLKLVSTDGEIAPVSLRWASKRFERDIAAGRKQESGAIEVPRGDRLSLAAAGAKADQPISLPKLFAQKDWGSRLQAPRRQLDRLANVVEKEGWTPRSRKLRDNIDWLLSVTAKLHSKGPWEDFCHRHNLPKPKKARPQYAKKNNYDALPWRDDAAKKRKGRATLLFPRLPGLRVIGVDLGHRCAAACAVWETLSGNDFQAIFDGGKVPEGLMWHKSKSPKHVYRRIGPNSSPAPWARLDRQFMIRLDGERDSRKLSPDEWLKLLPSLLEAMGLARDYRVFSEKNNFASHRTCHVDLQEAQSRAVQLTQQAIRRHSDLAKSIAAIMIPERVLPGQRIKKLSQEEHCERIAGALLDLLTMNASTKWACAEIPIDELPDNIEQLLTDKKTAGGPIRWSRKERIQLTKTLAPLAESLLDEKARKAFCKPWREYWDKRDCVLRKEVLRSLRDWIMPRGKANRAAIRGAGGLSLTRIATMRTLYQLMKSFLQRAKPDDPRSGVQKRFDERFQNSGKRMLDQFDRMRDNRVKQLASRIAEAALGLGTEPGKDAKRPTAAVHPPCHIVAIENLTNYRPDQLHTRRENRQLMQWSSAKVRDKLREACELNGLLVWEISPQYTSRQDSRTGLPGLRCADVPIRRFLSSPFWQKKVATAKKKAHDPDKLKPRDAYFVELCKLAEEVAVTAVGGIPPLRIPIDGGELFMSTDTDSPISGGLNADYNAAANIAIKAVLDPDWPGAWWYMPVQVSNSKPKKDSVQGAACIDLGKPLSDEGFQGKTTIVNIWRDPSVMPIHEYDAWRVTKDYWPDVEQRVVDHVRAFNRKRLVKFTDSGPVKPEDTPF